MTTTLLKKKLTKAINEIEDEQFLKALDTIVSSKQEDEMIYELSAAQKKELDKRKANHLSGKSPSYSWAQVKKAALKK
jgi:Putative addiction module component